MINGILGKKIGMTQVFDDKGDVHPVTVLQAGPCVITQIKRNNKDGYEAAQIGLVDAKGHEGTLECPRSRPEPRHARWQRSVAQRTHQVQLAGGLGRPAVVAPGAGDAGARSRIALPTILVRTTSARASLPPPHTSPPSPRRAAGAAGSGPACAAGAPCARGHAGKRARGPVQTTAHPAHARWSARARLPGPRGRRQRVRSAIPPRPRGSARESEEPAGSTRSPPRSHRAGVLARPRARTPRTPAPRGATSRAPQRP